MPSPFPGMDPYLEGSLWSTLHPALGMEIIRQIAPRLRPRYLALPTERLVTENLDDVGIFARSIYPEVGVVETGRQTAGAPVTVVTPAPLSLPTAMPERIPHLTVEIRDVQHRQLVTAIEILSPTNKRGEGRDEYLAKRRHILLSTAHLLEIDLLQVGRRIPILGELPPAPYFAFLSRADSRPMTEIRPIGFEDPLPVVPVPLLPGDADAPLDLQEAFTAVYDLLGYDLAIDYSQPTEVSLPVAAAARAEEILRRPGFRAP